MPKLKIKYADGTTDEIMLYTAKPTKPALSIFVGGGNLLCCIGRSEFI